MESIESLVAELNDICRQYIARKDQFQSKERLQELFMTIKEQGYQIVMPVLDYTAPEYELLSEEGKRSFEMMTEIRKKKIEAVKNHEFERAADLRDQELELIREIRMDLSLNNEDQRFILSGKIADMVIFNDPDNLLFALFR